MDNKKTIGIVPIRAGSKGLPQKNIRPLAGEPLFTHALHQGRLAGIKRFVISTDIPEVFEMDLGADVTVMARPADLATDQTTMADVLCDLLQDPLFDAATLVLLQATSPLRSADDIRRGITAYHAENDDLIMSICPTDRGVLKYGTMDNGRFTPMRDVAHLFSNRQALPAVYKPNGAVYVFGADWYRQNGSLQTDRLGTIEMSVENSIDVDTLEDLEDCEKQLNLRHKADTP